MFSNLNILIFYLYQSRHSCKKIQISKHLLWHFLKITSLNPFYHQSLQKSTIRNPQIVRYILFGEMYPREAVFIRALGVINTPLMSSGWSVFLYLLQGFRLKLPCSASNGSLLYLQASTELSRNNKHKFIEVMFLFVWKQF